METRTLLFKLYSPAMLLKPGNKLVSPEVIFIKESVRIPVKIGIKNIFVIKFMFIYIV